ncbi:HAD hydrolase-like protein [Arthrobacter sp. YAF16]|uniref:HAD hydrolase-like protein n=1 Tax=Arthrobacter sp. YAF16 TaxID=3233076 RepID=UPI003F9207A1
MTPTTVPVIFDLDGTLVDPAGGTADGIAAPLTELRLPHPGKSAADEAGAGPGAGPVPAGQAVMVGDRAQDVAGAAANGSDCVGVGWGFAPDRELHAAGAVEIVHTTAALHATITRLSECPGTTALNEVHTIGNV